MDDNDRIAEQRAREMETARPHSTGEAVQGRMARLDVSQDGEVPSEPRNEDMGARNGPQGTRAATQLMRFGAGEGRVPAGYGRVSGGRIETVVVEGVRKEN